MTLSSKIMNDQSEWNDSGVYAKEVTGTRVHEILARRPQLPDIASYFYLAGGQLRVQQLNEAPFLLDESCCKELG